MGWALEHLHDMAVSREYMERVANRIRDPRDAPPSYFTLEPATINGENEPPEGCRDFLPGDKLECVDPLNPNFIGSATVERVSWKFD